MGISVYPTQIDDLTYDLRVISSDAYQSYSPVDIYWSISSLSTVSVPVGDIVYNTDILAPIPAGSIVSISAFSEYEAASCGYIENEFYGSYYSASGYLYDYINNSNSEVFNNAFTFSMSVCNEPGYGPKVRNLINLNPGNNILSGSDFDANGIEYVLSGFLNADTKYYQVSYDTLTANGFYLSSDTNPAGVFFPMTGSNIVASYNLNYGGYTLNTICDPITTSYIRIKLANFNTRFYVSAYNVLGDEDDVIINPTPSELLLTDISPEFISLCAVKGNETLGQYFQNVIWEVSDPLSATMLNSTSTIYIETLAILPGVSADHLKFTSPSLSPSSYTISAYRQGSNVPATYDFDFDPIVSEGLQIQSPNVIDGFNASFTLERSILGQSGFIYNDYKIPAVSTVAWGITPTDSIIGFTGITGQDIKFPYGTISNFNITGYGDPLTFHQELTTGVIEALAQYATAVPGVSATVYVSGYINTIGGDIIQLSADPNTVASYTLCAYYFDNPSISATYVYIPQFPTNSIQISALEVVDTIEVKKYNLKGVNEYIGQITDINPSDTIVWSVSSPDDPLLNNVWAKYPNGILYTFNTPSLASELDNLVFYISSRQTTDIPTTSSYTITLSGPYIDNYDITIHEFLANSLFDLEFKINNEDPRDVNNTMWRLVSSGYQVLATDLSYIPAASANYTRRWDWGDGNITDVTAPTAYHTYNAPSLTTVTINFSAINVSAYDTEYTKGASEYMSLVFVDRFLSTDFIAYPSLVFPISDPNNPITLTTSNFTQTQGVCSYGEGHTAIFNLSAKEGATSTFDSVNYTNTFIWSYAGITKTVIGNGNTNTGTAFETDPSTTFNETGTAVSLSIFNDVFPTTMVSAYTADDGMVSSYPNFNGLLDDSSVYKQNIRIFPYESPSAVIGTYSNGFIIQQGNFLASETLTIPDFSPVDIVSRVCNWTITNGVWSDARTTTSNDNNSASLNYQIIKGEESLASTLPEGQMHLLTIGLSGTATERIYSHDFEESDKTFSAASIIVSAYVMPDILIYTDNNFVITGGSVIFENITNQAPSGLISAWMYDPGDGNIYTKYDFSPLEITYTDADTYTLNVTAVAFNGFTQTRSFPSITDSTADYQGYRSDIFRTYNVSEFNLPYSCNKDILLPPNEWVTSDNINAAFDRLNTNLNYISAVSKIYQSPPAYYYGWFGTSATETDANWHVNILGLSGGINDGFLTAKNTELVKLYDIAVGTEKIYLANDTKVQILSSDYSGTLIAETSSKAVGDPFVAIKAIDIDSSDRIYVLDAPKNRVAVLDYINGATNPWKLLYSWGGFGGAIAKTKFRNPTDLYVDSNDYVWVVDSDNLVIKKYSKSGGWVATIENNLFTESNKPISITKDLDNNLHILTKKYVVKLTEAGEFIETYNYFNDSDAEPKRIIHHVNDGFIYICLADKIIRLQKNGTPAGTFASNNITYNGIYQDSNQDIFVASDNVVLKYNEQITILDAMIDVSDYLWDIEDIYIDEDEYIADWVYNKSLSRMWDNIDIIRRSLKGKINVTTNSVTNETIISIKNFTVDEYNELISLTPKNEIYIGINEFVTADVINRNLALLCNMINEILKNID